MQNYLIGLYIYVAIARLGVYQLGLSAVEYMPLLKFALGADTLADSAVIIVLDWTRPWEFLETFQRWIDVLQHRIDEICKEGSAGESWSRGKAIIDDLREKGKLIYTSLCKNKNILILFLQLSIIFKLIPNLYL